MFYWYSNWACKTHNRTPYTSQAIFPVGYLLRFISNPHKANFDVCKERQCECINTQMAIRETTLSLLVLHCEVNRNKGNFRGEQGGEGGVVQLCKDKSLVEWNASPLSAEGRTPDGMRHCRWWRATIAVWGVEHRNCGRLQSLQNCPKVPSEVEVLLWVAFHNHEMTPLRLTPNYWWLVHLDWMYCYSFFFLQETLDETRGAHVGGVIWQPGLNTTCDCQ